MPAYAGQRPGSGSYECDSCYEIIILDDEDLLPKCPACKTKQYLYVGGLGRKVRTRPPSHAKLYLRLLNRT